MFEMFRYTDDELQEMGETAIDRMLGTAGTVRRGQLLDLADACYTELYRREQSRNGLRDHNQMELF